MGICIDARKCYYKHPVNLEKLKNSAISLFLSTQIIGTIIYMSLLAYYHSVAKRLATHWQYQEVIERMQTIERSEILLNQL